MARARNIKPGFFGNEDLAELPFSTRLLFIGLWTIADREGRLEDRPKRIKMAIFPGDSVDVDKALNELQQSGFLVRYTVNEARYIGLLAFAKHQHPHHKEPPSTIPKPGAGPSLTHIPRAPLPETSTPPDGGETSVSTEAGPSLARLIPDSLNLIPDTGLSDPGLLIAESGKGKKRAERGSRLPADWAPRPEDVEFCRRQRPDLNPQATADGFRDYWVAQPGSKAVKLDWPATWRNWVRKEGPVRANGSKQQSLEERNARVAAEWVAKQDALEAQNSRVAALWKAKHGDWKPPDETH